MHMRKFLFTAVVVALAGGGTASADCAGQDILAQLETSEPGILAELETRSAAVPNHEGRFWKIEKPGVGTSWLVGTYHDTEIAKRGISGDMLEALGAAERIVVEVTDEEQAKIAIRMATDLTFAFDMAAKPLDERIDPSLLPQFEEILATRGLNVAAVRFMRPWLLMSLLGVPACQQQAMAAGAEVMDAVLIGHAKGDGLPVLGLETHEEALSAFDRISADDMIALIEDALRTYSVVEEEDLRRSAVNLYLAGKTYAIWEMGVMLSERSGGDVALRKRATGILWEDVMIARNKRWAPKLLAEVAKGGTFVAVGALHLPTDEGVIQILRDAGYTVTRLD